MNPDKKSQAELEKLDVEIAEANREYDKLAEEMLQSGASFIPGYDIYQNLKDEKYGDAAIALIMEIPIAKAFKYTKRAAILAKIAKKLETVREKIVVLKQRKKQLETAKKPSKKASKAVKGTQKNPKKKPKEPCKGCEKRRAQADKRFKTLEPTTRPPNKHALKNREADYQKANKSQKKKIAEEIGEEGMNNEARKRGYKDILPPEKAGKRPQGFDGIYGDKDGTLIIGEAKGGYNGKKPNAILKEGYQEKQGTIAHAKNSAEAIIKSKTSTPAERKAAQDILGAIKRGERGEKPGVRVELFHTEHNKGVPGATKHYVLDQVP